MPTASKISAPPLRYFSLMELAKTAQATYTLTKSPRYAFKINALPNRFFYLMALANHALTTITRTKLASHASKNLVPHHKSLKQTELAENVST